MVWDVGVISRSVLVSLPFNFLDLRVVSGNRFHLSSFLSLKVKDHLPQGQN